MNLDSPCNSESDPRVRVPEIVKSSACCADGLFRAVARSSTERVILRAKEEFCHADVEFIVHNRSAWVFHLFGVGAEATFVDISECVEESEGVGDGLSSGIVSFVGVGEAPRIPVQDFWVLPLESFRRGAGAAGGLPFSFGR